MFIVILSLFIIVISLYLFNYIEPFEDRLPILNLVLYSTDNGGPYDRMKQLTSSYYKQFTFVNTYYYCFEPKLNTDYLLTDNILYIKGTESYIPGILQKTIKAIEYFNIQQYKYVVRSNISTIIRFDILEHDLKKNPVDYGCALCFDQEDIPFSSGTSIVLSSKVVNYMIENKDKLDMVIIDDVSIGKFIRKEMPEIVMTPVLKDTAAQGFYFVKEEDNIKELIKNNRPVFFRNHNGDRTIDVRQMENIIHVLNENSM